VHPVSPEPFGLVMPEAPAYGIPVLALRKHVFTNHWIDLARSMAGRRTAID
jgi:hypothetical protein